MQKIEMKWIMCFMVYRNTFNSVLLMIFYVLPLAFPSYILRLSRWHQGLMGLLCFVQYNVHAGINLFTISIHLNVFPFRMIVHWAICKHSATLNGRERCLAWILMLWHPLFTFCTCIVISRGLTLCQASSVYSDNTSLWYRFHVKLLQSSDVEMETMTLCSLMCMFNQGKQILCHCIWLGACGYLHEMESLHWNFQSPVIAAFMLNPPCIASAFSHSAIQPLCNRLQYKLCPPLIPY